MADQPDQVPTTVVPVSRPKRSDSLSKIAAALAKAQGAMLAVEKDAKGVHGKYGTLAATWNAIRKPLSDNEIAVYQRLLRSPSGPVMATMLIHSSGEFLDDCELRLIPEENGRMSVMQAMGSAVTYARRYSLQAVTGVAPEDDDDGAGGKVQEPKAESKSSPPKQSGPKPAANPPKQQTPAVPSVGNPGPGNPSASDDTLAALDEAMKARGIEPADVSYWLTTGNQVDLTKPKPVSEKLAKILIDLMGLEGFTGANLRQDADELKAKREAKSQATSSKITKSEGKASFVMPLGSAEVKGKPLDALSVETLANIRDWSDDEMKKNLKPKERALLFEINSQVREEIKTRGSK